MDHSALTDYIEFEIRKENTTADQPARRATTCPTQEIFYLQQQSIVDRVIGICCVNQ